VFSFPGQRGTFHFLARKCYDLVRRESMPKKSFAIEDLRRWQERGLLSDEQLRSILAEEGLEAEPQAKERKVGLNPVTVAYYFGGLLAFFSFTFFIGMTWDDLTDWARLGVTLGVILVIGALGVWLRFVRGYPTAGGLLLFVATAVLPLFIFTVAKLLGAWPDRASFYDLRFVLLYLCLGSLAGALAVLILTRFSLISLIVAAFVHLTTLDIAQIISGGSRYFSEVTAATCGGLIFLGIALTFRGKKSQAFWFKLYGLVGLQIAFTNLFIESDNVFFGLLFFFVYLIMVGLSLRFQEIIYLVFGAIGIYTYFTRLVFDTFGGTVYFPLLLGVIGISIVVLAVLYQRYRTRLFRRGA